MVSGCLLVKAVSGFANHKYGVAGGNQWMKVLGLSQIRCDRYGCFDLKISLGKAFAGRLSTVSLFG